MPLRRKVGLERGAPQRSIARRRVEGARPRL
jgi:hypothetical protein